MEVLSDSTVLSHPCATITNGITRQASRSSGATVWMAAAAYNACFVLRIALLLFPMTRALQFLVTYIAFTWRDRDWGTSLEIPPSSGPRILGVHPVRIYWDDATGKPVYPGLWQRGPPVSLIEPVLQEIVRKKSFFDAYAIFFHGYQCRRDDRGDHCR